MIRITLNGQSKELSTDTNLKTLINQFCQDSRPVVAELNGNIIKKNTWEATSVSQGDKIELVNVVGGG